MRQIKPFLLFASLLTALISHAQTNSGVAMPEGYKSGTVITADNSTHQGYLKDNIKKKGEILFMSQDSKPVKYKAAQLSEIKIDNTRYLVSGNNFYRLELDGPRVRLLRKANVVSDRIAYNGTEPIVINDGDGEYGDYFIQDLSNKKLQLIRKKDFAKIFESYASNCPPLSDKLKQGLSYDEIVQATALYNSCGN